MRFLLPALAALFGGAAHAVIITGDVIGGSANDKGGQFVELTEFEGLVIGQDNFDDPNIYAFNERQNVVWKDGIQTDFGRNVRANEVVASHYIAFDPISDWVQGWIQFDAPIIGIATATQTLDASDFLMSSAVTYENPELRGLEGSDALGIWSENPAVLLFALAASSPGDFIRVFTERSQLAGARGISETAVPLPAAAYLMVPAMALLGFRKRFQRRSRA